MGIPFIDTMCWWMQLILVLMDVFNYWPISRTPHDRDNNNHYCMLKDTIGLAKKKTQLFETIEITPLSFMICSSSSNCTKAPGTPHDETEVLLAQLQSTATAPRSGAALQSLEHQGDGSQRAEKHNFRVKVSNYKQVTTKQQLNSKVQWKTTTSVPL